MAGTRKVSGEDSGEDRERGRTARVPLPSPAMAVALLSLFVALGGSAWAVSKVGTKQIRNNAVTTPKIKPGAVNASRLANGAVTGPKLADGAVTGPKLAAGSVGAANLVSGSVGFDTLGLQTYLTAGPKESRAWTIPKGATAPQAAGVIHTDFERGFIKAEIVSFDDLVEAGSMNAAKSVGKVRMEGKDYVMADGDVVEFRFNV